MGGSDLFTGTLDILVLQAVTAGPLHGYAIGKRLRDRSDGVLNVEEGALYPALHRLEKQGWLEAEWAVSEKGRRAKYYVLTADGRQAFLRESRDWDRYVDAVGRVVGGEAGA